jgi:hypothetical protein
MAPAPPAPATLGTDEQLSGMDHRHENELMTVLYGDPDHISRIVVTQCFSE